MFVMEEHTPSKYDFFKNISNRSIVKTYSSTDPERQQIRFQYNMASGLVYKE